MENIDLVISNFLRKYLKENNISYKTFADSFAEIDPNSTLSPNAIRDIEKSGRKTNQSTLDKVAQVVLKNRLAKVEDLLELIKTEAAPQNENDDGTLKIGTGFTSWSSLILSLISEYNPNLRDEQTLMPSNLKFAICSKALGSEPIWISSKADIDTLKEKKGTYQHRYIADDLKQLLDEKLIDCALFLRRTFDALEFNSEEKPILFSRILIGYGTHMYVVTKEELTDKTQELTTPVANENINITNNLEKSDLTYNIISAKAKFVDLIENKKGKIISIGNKTIENDIRLFNKDRVIREALYNKGDEDKIKNIGGEYYSSLIDGIAKGFDNGNIEVLIIYAFAPFNNIIYHDLSKEFKSGRLKYYNFNLSQMVEYKSSYNLYVRPEVFKNKAKLQNIYKFLQAIDQHVSDKTHRFVDNANLVTEISKGLADLYYPDEDLGERILEGKNKGARMENDLKELDYSNQFIKLIGTFLRLSKRS